MAELKYGGSDVKIMYGSQEIGGATKLEPGTILYMSEVAKSNDAELKNAHLLSTTKNWSNIDGIKIIDYRINIYDNYGELDISSDDFKSLDTEKQYQFVFAKLTVSRSTVDGEYRLNVSGYNKNEMIAITAL